MGFLFEFDVGRLCSTRESQGTGDLLEFALYLLCGVFKILSLIAPICPMSTLVHIRA